MVRLPFNLIVVDVETGGKPENRIIELGAVRVTEDLEIKDTFEMLVGGIKIKPDARAVHGIRDRDVAGKPPWAEAWRAWAKWCKQWDPYVLGSWSDYDQTTLRDEYKMAGVGYPHHGHMLDVKSVVWWECLRSGFYSRTLPVARACTILGIPHEIPAHRALPDAITEAKLFQFAAGKVSPSMMKM